MDYEIFTDGACDIDADIAARYGIKFIPMEYSLGDEMRVYSGRESADVLRKFYNGQRRGDLTKTTQVNPYVYLEHFTPFVKEGRSVLYLALSGGLSETYKSALVASKILKESYPESEVYVLNTRSATGGMGVLCERACRNRESGMSAGENYDDLLAASEHIRHWFFVQDLNYLKRGGRISASTAAIGSMLNIKPILTINAEGKLETIAKKRGNKNAVNDLLERFFSSYDGSGGDSIYVIDADDVRTGDALAAAIGEKFPEADVRRCTLSPVIGAHTGPGMAAVCHMGRRL